MNNRTRTTLIISIFYFLLWAGVLSYAILSVNNQGERVEALAITIAEMDAKKTAADTTAQMITITKDERARLADFFVDEAEAISFLATIEGVARGLGVTLETTELEVLPKTDTTLAEIKTAYQFKGGQVAVVDFLRALESLPYHSRIPVMNINTDRGVWTGGVTLFVTITP